MSFKNVCAATILLMNMNVVMMCIHFCGCFDEINVTKRNLLGYTLLALRGSLIALRGLCHTPSPVDRSCLLRCQGRLKLGMLCTHQIFTTASKGTPSAERSSSSDTCRFSVFFFGGMASETRTEPQGRHCLASKGFKGFRAPGPASHVLQGLEMSASGERPWRFSTRRVAR